MQVNKINSMDFYGRKLNLNQAREVCAFIEKEYPYESLWKLGKFEQAKIIREVANVGERGRRLGALYRKMSDIGSNLDYLRFLYQYFLDKPVEYFSRMIEGIKEMQTLNCAEASRLVYMILRINDVDMTDADIISLSADKGIETSELDHIVTQTKGINNDIVIDALLGESDTKENMFALYKTKYADTFRLNEQDKILYDSDKLAPVLNDDETEDLRKKYPELVLF